MRTLRHPTSLFLPGGNALIPVIALAVLFCASCGQEEEQPTLTPDQVVEGFYDNLYFHDAQGEEEIEEQARYIRETFFQVATDKERMTLELALPSILAITAGAEGFEIDLSGITYEIVEQTETTAKVRMYGISRTTSPDGQVQQKDVDRVYVLKAFDGVWKIIRLN